MHNRRKLPLKLKDIDLPRDSKHLIALGKKLSGFPYTSHNSIEIFTEGKTKFESLKKDLTKMTLITVVGVEIGGEAYGTSAGEGRICLTIRGELEDELLLLKDRILALCEEKSSNMGFSYKIHDPFPETKNNDSCVEKIKQLCENYQYLARPMRWSEDFGYYLKEAPGAIFGIGGGDCAPLHTENYDFPDDLIETAVNAFQKLAR